MLVVFLCSCTSNTPDTVYKVSDGKNGLVLNAETELPDLDLIDRIEEEIRYFSEIGGESSETLKYTTPRSKISKAGQTTYTEIDLRDGMFVSHTVVVVYQDGSTKSYHSTFNSKGTDVSSK